MSGIEEEGSSSSSISEDIITIADESVSQSKGDKKEIMAIEE